MPSAGSGWKLFGQVEPVAIIDNPIRIANYEWRHRIYLAVSRGKPCVPRGRA